MGGSFVGINTALTALRAQRHGMDVTAQNVANATTEGYSRQRVNLTATGAPTGSSIHTGTEVPGGVSVVGQQRLRDSFLEARAATERGRNAQLETATTVLASVETAFGEPGDLGLQRQLAELWAGFGDLANNPGNMAARSQLLERARSVTEAFHDIDRSLTALSGAYDVQLRATAEETNTAAAGVAELNGAIRKGAQSGMPVNELMDRRDLLVGRLADLAGVSTRAGKDGMVDVYLGSLSLVRADEAVKVAVSPASGQAVELAWDRGPGTPPQVVELSEGTARGMLDAVATVLPGYRRQLDTVAAALAGQVNAVHAGGYDLDGASNVRLFDTDPAGGTVTAASISVAFTDPRAVAAASLAPTAGAASLDNGNATALAALGSPTRADSPDAAYRNVVVSLGVESQTSMRRVQVQASILGGINAAQESQAGVDIDEEMVNLLTYQRAYEGAARVMSAVDAALDTLINRTGMVGR